MWHIGIHIWDVDPFHLEPDYDEYHKVKMLDQGSIEIIRHVN